MSKTTKRVWRVVIGVAAFATWVGVLYMWYRAHIDNN